MHTAQSWTQTQALPHAQTEQWGGRKRFCSFVQILVSENVAVYEVQKHGKQHHWTHNMLSPGYYPDFVHRVSLMPGHWAKFILDCGQVISKELMNNLQGSFLLLFILAVLTEILQSFFLCMNVSPCTRKPNDCPSSGQSILETQGSECGLCAPFWIKAAVDTHRILEL